MKEKFEPFDYTKKIKERITDLGADLVGVVDVEPLKGLKLDPPDLLDPFTRAVSIGLQLPVAAFEQMQTLILSAPESLSPKIK